MSMIAMAGPSPHSAFNKRDYPWEGARSHSEYNTRQPERIALPPIRQAFPELQLRVQDAAQRPSATTSPTAGPSNVMTPPEYVHSPNSNKRRRLSVDEDRELERAGRVPRLYASNVPERQPSPVEPPRPSGSDTWASTTGASPYPPTGAIPPMRSPADVNEHAVDPRPALSGYPHATYERDAQMQREYPSRPIVMASNHAMEPAPAPYRVGPPAYPAYHHPSRVQSLSVGAVHSYEPAAYSAGSYGHHDFVRYGGDFGAMGSGGDDKRRKRRGNLPRVTTDKLRAWFLAHLDHPYPTEDEKQELMRQTGLQMNQISNWFINARRRQLPQMTSKSHRAESNASSSRDVDSKVLPTTERSEFEDKRVSATLSDGESYDDEVGMKGQHGPLKRESI